MMPTVAMPRRVFALTPSELRIAATIVRNAAEILANEVGQVDEASRYLMAADRIASVLATPRSARHQFLQASPALTEMSGRSRTLIEMIEVEPGDEAYRLRMAKLLFRALLWRPETFPFPND